MKKIILNEKAKKIIAWIMLVIMGIFSAIGIMTCIGGIYSCTTKDKAEVKKVYAQGEIEAVQYTIYLPNIITDSKSVLKALDDITFTFTNNNITQRISNPNAALTNQEWNGTDTFTFEWAGLRYEREDGVVTNINADIEFRVSDQVLIVTDKTIEPKFLPVGASYINTKQKVQYITFENITGEASENIYAFVKIYEQTYNFIPNARKEANGGQNTWIGAYNKGYNDGNKDKQAYGETQKNIGYNKGVEDANNYSFTGLISAVFDVPIQTIFGMLNFEILGINILTIVTSILSIALLIFVLKMIFG